MKKGFLLLLLISSFFADAQSLKEALYGGKLRNEPGTVIRKGDDLTAKMDTVAKKETADSGALASVIAVDSLGQKLTAGTQTTAFVQTTLPADKKDAVPVTTEATAVIDAGEPATEPVAEKAKDNNALVKEYMSSIVSDLKTEVLSSKKVKKDSYYVLVSYSIDTEGQMAVTDVFVSPENAFLQQQVKERLAIDAPRLSPTLSSNGTPRKVNKKYNFTLVKE